MEPRRLDCDDDPFGHNDLKSISGRGIRVDPDSATPESRCSRSSHNSQRSRFSRRDRSTDRALTTSPAPARLPPCAESGSPSRSPDVSTAGCTKRVWITQGCELDVVIAELPAAGGVIRFGGQELAKTWPDQVGPACPNGPAALCASISWPDLSPGHAGCSVERVLPTCGALVHDCACGGVELQLVAGRESCAGPIRLGWLMKKNPYWRCL